MTRRNRCFVHAVFAISAVIIVLVGVPVRSQEERVIHVSSVADLYAAVNDPGNAGRRIAVAPGTYFLDPTQANGGRLEFQQDMELVGQRGDSDAVVIDASNLPPESYALASAKTGPVRMGRGTNALEWLTIQNARLPAAAAVETDLPPGPSTTVVRVAHIVAQGNQRGIDFRNLGTAFNGHVLHAMGEDNVLRDNTLGEGVGIRVINTGGVTGATVRATLRGNQSYGNVVGRGAANLNSSGNALLIRFPGGPL